MSNTKNEVLERLKLLEQLVIETETLVRRLERGDRYLPFGDVQQTLCRLGSAGRVARPGSKTTSILNLKHLIPDKG